MKFAALAALLFSVNVFACPDFTGTYKRENEKIVVVQNGCIGFKITTSDYSTPFTPATVVEFSADGNRQVYGPMFVVASWRGDVLYRQFYGNATSVELIGDPLTWRLQKDASGYSEIFEDVVDEHDGSVVSEKIYLGVTK